MALRGIIQRDEGEDRQAGREEVARRGGVRGGHAPVLLSGRKTTEEGASGLGRRWLLLGCTGKHFTFLFSFLFF